MTGDPAAYLEINKANWDARAAAHAASPGYDLDRFRRDPQALSDVVTFDRPRLGDLHGLRGLHLQCHIGTDTLSLHRLGAQMTGLDLSPESLREARALAAEVGADITYVESELYAAPAALAAAGAPTAYDLVFTGIGALCWLPSVQRWAEIVAGLLAPGGRLFLREGHPVLWTIDELAPVEAGLVVRYPYFEHEAPLVWDEPGTYVETDVEFAHNLTHSWNHGLGDIVSALLGQGLRITALEEHDSVPWDGLPGRMEDHPTHPGERWLSSAEDRARLPLTYTLQAVRD